MTDQTFLLLSLLMTFRETNWLSNWQEDCKLMYNPCKKGIPITWNSIKCPSMGGCHHLKRTQLCHFVIIRYTWSVAWVMKLTGTSHHSFFRQTTKVIGWNKNTSVMTISCKVDVGTLRVPKTRRFTFSVVVSTITTKGKWEKLRIRCWSMILKWTNSILCMPKAYTSIQEKTIVLQLWVRPWSCLEAPTKMTRQPQRF